MVVELIQPTIILAHIIPHYAVGCYKAVKADKHADAY